MFIFRSNNNIPCHVVCNINLINHATLSYISGSGYASVPIRKCLFIDHIITFHVMWFVKSIQKPMWQYLHSQCIYRRWNHRCLFIDHMIILYVMWFVTSTQKPCDIELYQWQWIRICANQKMFIYRLYNNILCHEVCNDNPETMRHWVLLYN